MLLLKNAHVFISYTDNYVGDRKDW